MRIRKRNLFWCRRLWSGSRTVSGTKTYFDATVDYAHVPRLGLGSSKDFLYVTQRGIEWPIETIESSLQELGVECRKRGFMLLRRIAQRTGLFPIWLFMTAKASNSRNSNFGTYIAVLRATRGTLKGNGTASPFGFHRDTSGFADMLKACLKKAEKEAR